jgi:hypothetical protein
VPRHKPAVTRPRESRRATPRQVLQVAVPFGVPLLYGCAIGSLFKLDHPVLSFFLAPVSIAVILGAGFGLRFAGRELARISVRRVPRWLYALAGPGVLMLVPVYFRVAMREAGTADATGYAISACFVVGYSAAAGLVLLGRAVVIGPRRRALWLFPPHWLDAGPSKPGLRRSSSVPADRSSAHQGDGADDVTCSAAVRARGSPSGHGGVRDNGPGQDSAAITST